MTVWEYPIKLYDKQRQAVASQADEVLFGGSLAGGKTEMILKHMVDICLLIPGAKVLVIRKNYPQMVEIEQRLRLRIPKEVATLNKSDHVMTFKHNGAELHLGYLNSDEAAENYQGHQYVQIGYDELTHYDQSWVDRVNERLRDPEREALMEEHGLRIRMLAASNPGSRGHAWVRERFIDPAPAGEMFEVEATDEFGDPLLGKDGQVIKIRRQFIPSSLWDNPYINHDAYLARLSGMDPERKRAMIYGDWTIPSGIRFPQFRAQPVRGEGGVITHPGHVVSPEELPLDVVGHARVVGVDFGFSRPFAAVWMAKVKDIIVVYREEVVEELTATQQAERILAVEAEGERRPERPITVALDPAGWRRDINHVGPKLGAEDAPLGSIAHSYRKVLAGTGGEVVKGLNDRVHGWATLDELLAVDPKTGLPRVLIYNTCRRLIKALQGAPRDKRRPEDVDTTYAEDDVLDSFRYGYMELLGRDYHRKLTGHERLAREGRSDTVTGDVGRVGF